MLKKDLGEFLKNQVLSRILKWLSERYCPEHVRKPLIGDRRSFSRRLWDYNWVRFFGVDGLVLLMLLGLVLYCMQLWAIHQLVFNNNASLELRFPSWLFARFQYAFQIPLFALVVMSIAVLTKAMRLRTISPAAATLFAVILLTLVVGNMNYSYFERLMITEVGNNQVIQLAVQQLSSGLNAKSQTNNAQKHLVIAERLLRGAIHDSLSPEELSTIWMCLSVIAYYKQDFGKSIEEACRCLSLNPDKEVAEKATMLLRYSIYYLAHEKGTQFAEAMVNEIRHRYGTRCAVEASPYWLAISPELMTAFEADIFQSRGPWWEYFPKTGQVNALANKERFNNDMAYLEQLVDAYPDEGYLDYALFLLGHYLDLIVHCPNSDLLEEAHYAWALQAFNQKLYGEAVRRFGVFVDRFNGHEWSDDALWRMAKAYFMLGDYIRALQYLTMAKNQLAGGMAGVDPYADIAYILDVRMTDEQIRQYAQLNTDAEVGLIITFTLAEKYFVSGRLSESLSLYDAVIQSAEQVEPIRYTVRPGDTWHAIASRFHFPDWKYLIGTRQVDNLNNIIAGQVLTIPSPTARLAQICLRRKSTIARIESILAKGPPDSIYELANFYSVNPDVFKNAFLLDPSLATIESEGVPLEYFLMHNAPYRLAELLMILLEDYPQFVAGLRDEYGPPGVRFTGTEAVLYRMGEAYDQAASDRALADPAAIDRIRQKAVASYRNLLIRLPEKSREFDVVYERIGAVYLHRWDGRKGLPWGYAETDVRGLLKEYQRLSQEYPHHHLANNALNWVAWAYCYLANFYTFSPEYMENPDWQEYQENYRRALEIYEQLAGMDPLSGITRNAIEATAIIREKLADPTKRVPVPWQRWSW